MHIKFFFIQKIKALFALFRLHYIIEPFSGILLNLAYLSKQSKWINQNKNLPYNDFFSGNRDREKRLGLYTYLNKEIIKVSPINYMEFGVAHGAFLVLIHSMDCLKTMAHLKKEKCLMAMKY